MYTTNFSNNISELGKTYIPNSRLRSLQKGLLLESKLVRTETYKGYYSNRIVTLWNKLPPELRADHSLDIFVGELDAFYCNKFKDTFTSNDICSWTSTCRCQACACF